MKLGTREKVKCPECVQDKGWLVPIPRQEKTGPGLMLAAEQGEDEQSREFATQEEGRALVLVIGRDFCSM